MLIFHLGALGDFVLTWPLVLALARIYPQSRVIYVTHRQKGLLAEKVLRIESADVEAGWHHLFGDPAQLPEPAKRMLVGAHTILSFAAGPDDPWSQNVRSLAPEAQLLTVAPNPPAGYARHVTQFHLEQLKAHPVIASAAEQMLASVAQRGVAPSPPGGDVVIHPGSGSDTKCWPKERYLALIARLKQEGRTVRVVLGEAELERWSAAEVRAFESATEVRKPTTFLELFEELKSARVGVFNDSGPAHLAGIVGVPTISIFGPTDPRVWHPLGPHVAVLHSQSLEDVTVEDVLAAVTAQTHPK